ncbi:MAG TPA: hypothetical protein VMI54_00330 [Polyangiaceae bacterium]|nr:hypothetical protein [Polyangiaceae bacterium]
MQAQRIQVKIYAPSAPKPDALVPVFHGWIREKKLDELAIDVADYEHVHEGPGVVLVGHQFDYYWDLGEGRPGLVYLRKREPPAPAARLTDAVRRALVGCRLLEQEPALAGIAFKTDELLVKLPDRLRAPADDAHFGALKDELASLGGKLYAGSNVTIERMGDARDVLGARLKASSAPSIAELLARVS